MDHQPETVELVIDCYDRDEAERTIKWLEYYSFESKRMRIREKDATDDAE